MDSHQYKEILKNRLRSSFDILEPPKPLTNYSDLWAVHNRLNEKYFLSKKISLYSMNNDEYVSLKLVSNQRTAEFLEECQKAFSDYISSMRVAEGHMSSLFNLVLLTEAGVEDKALNNLSKHKFHKDFCFTLKGWADLAVFVVDLKDQKVFSNPKGSNSTANFQIF